MADYPGHRVRHISPRSLHQTRKPGKRRLAHSLRVALLAYTLAGAFRVDKEKSARAGLLHDCGFDPESDEYPLTQVIRHPTRGARIARKLGESEDVVRAIYSHMFPISFRKPPVSRLSFTVWLADKLDSFLEFLSLSPLLDKRINDYRIVTVVKRQ